MSKTLFKMISIFTGLIAVVLLVFSIVSSYLFDKAIEKQTYEKNDRELNIISDSIQEMHENVKQLAFNIMGDASYDTFLRNDHMGSASSYNVMMDLGKDISLNPYYHSVSLYSGYAGGEYFSTLTSHSGEDDFFREAVENYQDMPVLTPVCRVLPSDVYYVSTTVYSYFYYETDSKNKITKAIIINMDAQWLCNYLNRLKGKTSKAYIIDRTTHKFIDGSTQIYSIDETDKEFLRNYSDVSKGQENHVINDRKEGKLITYLWLKNPEWILVVAEQNDQLLNAIASMRHWIIRIVTVLFLFSLIMAILTSRRIYKPWNELFQKITGGGAKASRVPNKSIIYDDVSAIHESLESTSSQLAEYSLFKNSMKDLLLETYIRSLLQDDTVTKSRLLEKDIEAFNQILSRPMMIVLFRIDCWEQVRTTLNENAKGCFSRLSESMISSEADYKSIKWIQRALDSGEVFMIALSQKENLSEEEWRERIVNLQQRFREKYGCTVSAAVGDVARGTEELKAVCRKAAKRMHYSILYNRQSIFNEKTTQREPDGNVKYDRSLEGALCRAVCERKLEEALEVLENALQKYRIGNLHRFLLYVTQMFLNLDRQLDTIDRTKGSQMAGLARNMYRMMPEFESLDDIREKFTEEFQSIPLEKNSLEDKHNAVVDAVKEYIEEHYSEEIVLKSLAANFNFSPGYLGTLFRENVGMSVLEYTNEVRLGAAAQMIQNTSLNIIDIMQRTGFINESNFYKLFKKKYGVTPKAYRINTMLQKRNE